MDLSWAVLRRELNLEARRPANYRLRFILGAAVTGLVWFTLLSNAHLTSGRAAFYFLHNCMLALVFICGPAIAADSLSKEKREGTLGLLFLTPLTAWQIVSGKFLTHLMKLGTFWALALPLISVPLMQGGVSGLEVGISFLFQFITMLLVLAGSLLASSAGRRWFVSLISAYFLAALVVMIFFLLVTIVAFIGIILSQPNRPPLLNVFFLFEAAFYVLTGADDAWPHLFVQGPKFWWLRELPLYAWGPASVFCSILLLKYCARRILRFAEQEIETKRQAWFRRVFLTPLYWRDRFRATMLHKLDNNPFIWLEYRTAWSRAGRWLLVFLLILFETCLVASGSMFFDRDWWIFQRTLLYVIAGIIAFTAASSFQKERECGAFELLLVTPLKIPEIIWGRVTAVWRYYVPLITTLIVFIILPNFWMPTRSYYEIRPRGEHLFIMGWFSLLTIPFLGLYFSLRFKNFLAILMPTLFIGLIGPAVLVDVAGFLQRLSYSGFASFYGMFSIIEPELFPFTKAGVFIHLLVIAICYTEIHNILTRRQVTT